MKLLKLFQYDKYVEKSEIHRSWQLGIFNNRSFLWVNYETPGFVHSGFHVALSFLTDSLLGVEINNNKKSLSFYFITEYFSGWEND